MLAGLLALLAHARPAGAAYEEIEVQDGGTIRGRVTLAGAPPSLQLDVSTDRQICHHEEGRVASPRLRVSAEGGVADTVVYLRDISRGKPMASLAAPMTLDQKGCLYEPFVQVMPQKGVLSLVNSDPLNHNVHARQEGQRDPFNYAMPNSNWPEKQTIQKRMIRPGLVSVSCDVHLWMNAYLFVVEHPYYAVTDAEGRYELTGVPAGTYELVLWHAGWGANLKRTPQGQAAGYTYDDPITQTREAQVMAGGVSEVDFELSPAQP